MVRWSRADRPGAWHHVMNRGIARRTIFELRADFRHFTAQLAKAVHRGELELHAFALMPTHYHLLVRSPRGVLAQAMQRIQLAYSRQFNRSRRRDGGLFRGRFRSKLVETLEYRHTLVRYIDNNPLQARIVERARDYPYGSAIHYARPSGPIWLERSWVDSAMATDDSPISDELAELVEARIHAAEGEDPLDNLVTASHRRVQTWMRHKASVADGSRPNLPTLPFGALERVIEQRRHEAWSIKPSRKIRDGWSVALAGLGRQLTRLSYAALAERLMVSESTATRLCRIHNQQLRQSEDYAARIAELTVAALRTSSF